MRIYIKLISLLFVKEFHVNSRVGVK